MLTVQITEQIAEKHLSEDALIREVQNAITTGQQLSTMMRVDSLLVLTLMQEEMGALLQYWLQPAKWATKGTAIPSCILNPLSEHILYEMLQEP